MLRPMHPHWSQRKRRSSFCRRRLHEGNHTTHAGCPSALLRGNDRRGRLRTSNLRQSAPVLSVPCRGPFDSPRELPLQSLLRVSLWASRLHDDLLAWVWEPLLQTSKVNTSESCFLSLAGMLEYDRLTHGCEGPRNYYRTIMKGGEAGQAHILFRCAVYYFRRRFLAQS